MLEDAIYGWICMSMAVLYTDTDFKCWCNSVFIYSTCSDSADFKCAKGC
jgi:hypothetical protein